jgi:prepilin-type N-terminal cleavage/methylation domain-containing protein
MASTSTSSKARSGGYTLVEMLVASAVGTIILAGVLTTYILSVRGYQAITNYWMIHSDGRYAVDRFAADMRAVYSITSFATNGPLVVVIPLAFSSSGVPTATKTITYTYTSGKLLRTDSSTGTTAMLATNIYNLKFRMFNRNLSNETILANAKSIQLEVFLRKYTANRAQTEDYLSARLDMRNKP